MRHYSKDGVNRSLALVMRAVKRAKLVEHSLFPAQRTTQLAPYITAVRVLNANEYLAAGSPHDNFSF